MVVFSNPFEQNLDRYRKKAQEQVGGSPRAVMTAGQPGFEPCPIPVFMDDAVIIKKKFPDTNFHATQTYPLDLRVFEDSTGADEKEEIYIRFERRVNKVVALSFTGREMKHRLISDNTDEQFQWSNGAILFCNLILTPLDVTTLTWNNASWESGADAHGTLYDTPANFDANGNAGYHLDTDIVTAESNESTKWKSLEGFGSGVGTDDTVQKRIARYFDVPKQGPVFGIHLYFAIGSNINWHRANAPDITFLGSGAFRQVTTEVHDTRPSVTPRFKRGYILEEIFFLGAKMAT